MIGTRKHATLIAMTRAAGPISVSPALASVFGLCRAIRLSAEEHAVWELPGNATPRTNAVLELEDIVALEYNLGATIADDVLATMASGIRLLVHAAALDFDSTFEIAQRASEEVAPEWVAIAEVGEWPLDPNSDDTPRYYLCVPHPGSASDARVVMWEIGEGPEAARAPMEFAEYLRVQLKRAFQTWDQWPHVVARAPKADPTIEPVLRALTPVVAPATRRRVRHKTYGAGTVITDLGDGKLQIEFDTAGRKQVMATFVTEIES